MNRRQRWILRLAALAIATTLLFPPFQVAKGTGQLNLGYHFILTPPTYYNDIGTAHVALLLTQWAGILIVAGLLWFLAKD